MHEHDLSGLSRYPLAFGAVQSIHLCDVMPALVRCLPGFANGSDVQRDEHSDGCPNASGRLDHLKPRR
jgi:hypothetical protein